MLARFRDIETLRARLLESSELRIAEAAHERQGHAALAASRVLESAQAWRDWSITHNQLIASIASQRGVVQQVLAVKRMALSVIHRKAPFEYLRDHAVRAGERQRYFQTLFGRGDYARAVVREHRQYLAAMCSYLCVERFCGSQSLRSFRDYERRYTHYWALQSQAASQEAGAESSRTAAGSALLRYLREETREARATLLDGAPSAADRYTIEELRRPTGDTVRLRRLPQTYQR